jgi:hypothetical protein
MYDIVLGFRMGVLSASGRYDNKLKTYVWWLISWALTGLELIDVVLKYVTLQHEGIVCLWIACMCQSSVNHNVQKMHEWEAGIGLNVSVKN